MNAGELPAAIRPTRLIVDRQAIESNAAIILRHVTPGTRLMAVVKANAYGHGAVASARAAIAGGASYLGVATVGEAVQLRDCGIDTPILVLGSSAPAEAYRAAQLGICLGVGDTDQLARLQDVLRAHPPEAAVGVHLKIDTGMRRFGILPNRAVDVARTIDIDPYLRLQGIYSHLAEADEENPARMNAQIELFRQAHATISEAGVDPGIAHISNSAALLRTRSSDFGMVRAGICLYGISPSRHVALFRGMKPALEWRATVQHLISMEPGDRTGYGGTYVASDNERLALIPIGYADGYPRQLSNIGWMGFDGQRLQVRGRISMDQCTIAIPGQIDLKVGDDVTVLGGAGNGAPSANELGDVLGTIGYEIVSRISPRVPVEYV